MSALFIIAKTWIQSKCPSAGECMSKLYYVPTRDYHSAVKMLNNRYEQKHKFQKHAEPMK